MESANLHHHHQHQLQDYQFVGSSSLSTPSFYAGVVSNNTTWNPNLILNSNNLNGNVNGGLSNSRELKRHGDILVPPPLDTSMVQDLGYHHCWASNTSSFTNQSAHDLNLAKIKEELSDSPHKFRQTTINDQSHSDDLYLHSPSYMKHERQPNLHDLSEKLFLKTFSSGCQLNELQGGALYSSSQNGASFGVADACSRGSYSQIFPSANISNLNPSSSPFLSSSGMNLQVLDLLNSTKFGGGYGQPANIPGLYKETPSFGLDHMQDSTHWLTNSPDKVPSFTNGTTETKRSSTVSEPKASHTAPKKARFESRSSLTPFKVRKEKLGDRIAALQQLVAPFGKTDTASVLMEAIGYIKFLQDQVETLSVPYMKSSRNSSTHRSIQEGSTEDGEQETKPDLKSRGLCLVPLTCMSYITNDNLGVWPGPPNYCGGGGGGGRT